MDTLVGSNQFIQRDDLNFKNFVYNLKDNRNERLEKVLDLSKTSCRFTHNDNRVRNKSFKRSSSQNENKIFGLKKMCFLKNKRSISAQPLKMKHFVCVFCKKPILKDIYVQGNVKNFEICLCEINTQKEFNKKYKNNTVSINSILIFYCINVAIH